MSLRQIACTGLAKTAFKFGRGVEDKMSLRLIEYRAFLDAFYHAVEAEISKPAAEQRWPVSFELVWYPRGAKEVLERRVFSPSSGFLVQAG